MKTLKILIADDHAVVRRGVRQLLLESVRPEVVEEAESAAEALRKAGERDWDIVILDVSLPGRTGLDVLAEIKRTKPGLPVLMLSMHPEDQYAVRALRMGAAGYLTKDQAPEEIARAVRRIINGGRYVSPSLAEKLAFALGPAGDQAPHEALSEREFEVFRLIASGRSVSEIGRDIHLSVKTVSTYRARVLEKMGLATNADLTRYAIKAGLVD